MTAPEPEWTPAFPGQRPPLKPGHELSMIDGHRSERRVGPLAAQIAADLLADPDVPKHLRQPMFAASVDAWSRAEAVCALLWAWIAERDLIDSLTAITEGTEDEEETGKGKVRRRTKTRSVGAVLDTLRKYESIAANLRSKLGLDPTAAARVGKDLALARHLDAGATPLDEAVAKIQRGRELAAGGSDG